MADSIIKATCQRCGDVELEPSQVELRICSIPDRSVYAFTCPSCRTSVLKPAADPRVVTLLRSVGVPSVGWEFPVELNERRDGPPLTGDDLIDLMLLLEQPDFMDRLSAQRTSL